MIGLTYSPDDVVDENYLGKKYLVLRSSNIQNNKIELSDTVFVTKKIPQELKVQKDDILICARNGSRLLVGKSARINSALPNTTFGAFMTVFRSKINSFLSFYFNSNQFQSQTTIFLTTTINQLTNHDLNEVWVSIPPLAEQKMIADFLDRETAKIDSLIQKRNDLIKLLQEKRSAVISHAVTKGIDPTVRLKPSNIDWLGEIPEHWDVKRARFMLILNPSPHEITLSATQEVSFIPMEAIGENGQLCLEQTRPIADVSSGYTYFRENDITFAKITPCFENGKAAKMCHLLNNCGFGTTELTVLRCSSRLNSDYLFYITKSELFRKNGEAWMYGAGGQKRVSDEFVKNFRFAFPPISEQKKIADFLDRETAKIDSLIEKEKQIIEKMKEYRTALISAAVTGKIDVRGEENA